MQTHKPIIRTFDPQRLAVVGISFREAPIELRQRFVINVEARNEIYVSLREAGVPFCMILSTCNRTEIYTDRDAAGFVRKLWFEMNAINSEIGEKTFLLRGYQAVKHFFSVISGTESQIPGDMQIAQQCIVAFTETKTFGLTHGLFEKLFHQAIHCSKRVRTETKLSTGITSVSSAVTMLVRKYLQPDHRIVIIGVGCIGKISCQNLLKTVPAKQITVINRTGSKAVDFAKSLGVNHALYEEKDEAIASADIIIISTSASQAVVTKSMITSGQRKLILDLSVPAGVDAEILEIPGISVMNVDMISQFVESHLGERDSELKHAFEIISKEITSTSNWWHHRETFMRTAPQLPLVKLQLKNA